MYALIADDDPVTAAVLGAALRRLTLEVVTAHDGAEAWDQLGGARAPALAVVDWMMPNVDGIELCRRIRQTPAHAHMYVILLTARDSRADVVAGLEAGADDYLVKPFDAEELRARVRAGVRILTLQKELTERIEALRETIASVRQLKGLLPICCYCKSIRTDADYWQQLEGYISDHSEAQFSHGICPDCIHHASRELDEVN
ncbi:MAG: response regulator transcription factor [Vicinamibacterales bacterium]